LTVPIAIENPFGTELSPRAIARERSRRTNPWWIDAGRYKAKGAHCNGARKKRDAGKAEFAGLKLPSGRIAAITVSAEPRLFVVFVTQGPAQFFVPDGDLSRKQCYIDGGRNARNSSSFAAKWKESQ
jgi:hypothetical protein